MLEAFEKEQRSNEKHGREFASSFMSSGGELSTEWWCVEDLVENAPTVSEWISVEERLPDDTHQKIVFHSRGVSFAYYNGSLWWSSIGKSHNLRTVTHWMDMPDPPEVK